ncbi:MAG: hypothetical protein JGK30_16050 [Microcoleus sp. PH2017_40_RAT_O_B]|uniref:hypothetical protein n=1 Tax=unclassified Microcoleus TaxID=2642155 RepID=UPI001D29CA19|nr:MULTISPECIES: hypothetical protein [unclassified Microcoleus]MCC3493103.1 hypothetical protein [Microcoleus sp. PH2017_16_JOR_D_A]MCC3573582.1 hypothetical protein [Microcoleus sp. PH2017_34_RAT_O_A]MCC3610977.1 hypothetical protein [Microcoleus sp. PH2017_40_RAT_O_B]
MAYSDFTLRKVKQSFGLTSVEGGRFLPEVEPIAPSAILAGLLADTVPWAIAVGTEKAKSELIIAPALLEVKRLLNRQISVFSGTDFTVDTAAGLNGVCDFLISRSPEQFEIEAPAVMLVEAKRDNINSGLGQCIAEMVAAQRFNEINNNPIPIIYGSVTTGTAWRFMKLEGQVVTIDVSDYPFPPVETILSMLVWMVREG